MPFFKETNNKIVFYPKLYNNRYISGELDLIEDYDVCVRVVDGVAKEEGYAEDLFDEKFDAMFLKADWYGEVDTVPTAPSLPELETEEFLEIVELPEAHTLGVVDREAKGSVSVVPTEELLMNRTSSSTERSNKRFKLIEDPSIHTWVPPSKRNF